MKSSMNAGAKPKMKPMRAAVRKFEQDEHHPSSENPGLKKNAGSIKTTPTGHEALSGSKGEFVTEAAHTMYERAVKNGCGIDEGGGDQAVRHR